MLKKTGGRVSAFGKLSPKWHINHLQYAQNLAIEVSESL